MCTPICCVSSLPALCDHFLEVNMSFKMAIRSAALFRWCSLGNAQHQSSTLFFNVQMFLCRKQSVRLFCMKPKESPNNPQTCPLLPNKTANGGTSGTKLTLGQRFKAAYKQYGKVLIGVHLVLSCGWYGSFYLIASSGFDVAGLLENWGFTNERLSNALRSSAGNAAVAYLLYKLASPVRYAMTLAGTHLAVRSLRHFGYMKNVANAAKSVK